MNIHIPDEAIEMALRGGFFLLARECLIGLQDQGHISKEQFRRLSDVALSMAFPGHKKAEVDSEHTGKESEQ